MRWSGASPRVTWWEFALRLALAATLLLAIDALIHAEVHAVRPAFDKAYRLPDDNSLDRLEPLIRHIRQVRAEHPSDVIVVFLGASPAYGVGIRDPAHTFSAAFESAAASDPVGGVARGRRRVHAYNLAANGLLLGDQYVIAKAVGDSADLVVVQLTYQTFDPRRSVSKMREADLPSMLHVGISAEEARALGTERRTDTELDREIDRAVRSHWFALGTQRDVADALSLTGGPAKLYRLASGEASPATDGAASAGDRAGAQAAGATGSDAAVDPTTPFDELDPALQMVAISRASENSRFTLNASSSELVMLGRIARYFRSHDRRAVFFLAPMDEEILAAYEVLDEKQYERNTRRLSDVLAGSGYTLVDYHAKPFLTSSDFVDLTHTTDSGGVLTGERLWQDLRSTLESLTAR